MNDLIEEQGPIAGWCQAIDLFTAAARNAGPDLNRRTFVTAMSKITDFPGTWTTVLSYGPDKRYGPTEYQVVNCGSTHRPRRCARRPWASLLPQPVGYPSSRSCRCPPVDRGRVPATGNPGKPVWCPCFPFNHHGAEACQPS